MQNITYLVTARACAQFAIQNRQICKADTCDNCHCNLMVEALRRLEINYVNNLYEQNKVGSLECTMFGLYGIPASKNDDKRGRKLANLKLGNECPFSNDITKTAYIKSHFILGCSLMSLSFLL